MSDTINVSGIGDPAFLTREVTLEDANDRSKMVSQRRVQLEKKSTVGPVSAGGESDLAIVVLEKFDLVDLLSRDTSSKLEGSLVFDIGGQSTSLPFRANKSSNGVRLSNPNLFKSQLLYFGKPKGELPLEADMQELDKEAFSNFEVQFSSFLDLVGSLGAFTPYGAVVTPAMAFVKALVKFIGSRIDDDLELGFFGGFGEIGSSSSGSVGPDDIWDLDAGSYNLKRFVQESGVSDFQLPMTVRRFRPESLKSHATVVLKKIDLGELGWDNLGVPNSDKQRNLVLEAVFGSGEKAVTTQIKARLLNRVRFSKFARFDDVVGINNKVVYSGPWMGGVPFSFSANAAYDEIDGTSLKTLIDEGAKLTTAIQAQELKRKGAAAGEIAEGKALIDNISKAAQAFVSLALSFQRETIPIGEISGLAFEREALMDASGQAFPVLNPNRFLALEDVGTEWEEREVVIGNADEEGGQITVTLMIRRHGPPTT